MKAIGIFSFFQGTVIGVPRPLSEAEHGLPGVFDSSDTHIDLWENAPCFLATFPHSMGTEYQ